MQAFSLTEVSPYIMWHSHKQAPNSQTANTKKNKRCLRFLFLYSF